MKKWIFAICCIFLATLLFYFYFFQTQKPIVPTTAQVIQKKEESVGNPVRLSIPKYHVTAAIESVGLDSKKRMDIPRNFNDVAWYNLGFKPGQKGSAVIDGHVDTPTGAPAVFATIASLQSGDYIQVIDSQDKTYTFTVTTVVTYPFDQLPLEKIFNTTDKPRLNLITCAGTWDKLNKNYSDRTVVYAEVE